MPVSQSAFCWPKFVLGREFPGHNHAPIWLTLVLLVGRNKSALWQGVLSRCERGKSKKVPSHFVRHDFEKRALGALRVGDVRKALQSFVAAPIAPKTPETFQALKELHPPSPPPNLPLPTHEAPIFQEQHVRSALFSFSPTSAAGFGYRPSLLQQCARTESFHFVSTLTRAVNVLASGPYVPSAFPRRWSVDCPCKAEPGCPASLLRRSTPETSREMFLLGWQGGDLPRV